MEQSPLVLSALQEEQKAQQWSNCCQVFVGITAKEMSKEGFRGKQ